MRKKSDAVILISSKSILYVRIKSEWRRLNSRLSIFNLSNASACIVWVWVVWQSLREFSLYRFNLLHCRCIFPRLWFEFAFDFVRVINLQHYIACWVVDCCANVTEALSNFIQCPIQVTVLLVRSQPEYRTLPVTLYVSRVLYFDVLLHNLLALISLLV